jgi:glycerol-3-phosphate dehydrogenase
VGVNRTETVLVVGGGVTGVGVARDLAMRGVDVTLVERGTFAGGTSGRSHGLLHSGARYAVDDPRGAEECLEESEVLKEIAPHCLDETGGFVVQVEGDGPDYFERVREACDELGMRTETLTGEEARTEEPGLVKEVERVLRVPDGVVHPSRLTVANAMDASERGAEVLSGTAVISLRVEDGRVAGATLEREGESREIDVSYVVNAAGPWAGAVAGLADCEVEMAPTSGVMVAVEYDSLGTVLNRARAPDDGDIVIPHPEEVILGTTARSIDDRDEVPEEEWEVEAMFEECGAMLSGLDPDRVTRSYWGVRPLYSEDRETWEGRGISRGFYLLDHDERDGVEGMVTITGGKLTTYRGMAEATADAVCRELDVDEPCRTADASLWGADDVEALDRAVLETDARNPADEDLLPT